MNVWQDNAPVQFVENNLVDYPLIVQSNPVSSDGCAATIGYRPHEGKGEKLGGRMLLGIHCTRDSILHELGHVLGLYHEHARPDRDNYIKIYWGNIRSQFYDDFEKPGLFAESIGRYDYLSIMHYPCHDPGTGKLMLSPTKEDAPSCDAIDSPKSTPSDGDLFAVYTRYPPSVKINGLTNGQKIESGTKLLLTANYNGPGAVQPRLFYWLLDRSIISQGTTRVHLDTSRISCGPHTIELQVKFPGETTPTSSKRVDFYILDCLQWILVDPPINLRLTAVSFGRMFIAVGLNGTVLYSTDGYHWFRAAVPTNEHLWSVAYAGDKYVAVGNFGTILVSENGTHWRQIDRPVDFGLSSVTLGKGKFVAVGFSHFENTGVIIASADGSDWTIQKQVPYRLWGVSYGNGKFVAVGNGGHVLTSMDGSRWVEQQPISSGNALTSVTYNDTYHIFVAVGTRGAIIFSNNGSDWVKAQSVPKVNLYGVTYGRARFVAVGFGGIILQSKNGESWASVPSITSHWLDGVTFHGSRFVVVGEKGTILISR